MFSKAVCLRCHRTNILPVEEGVLEAHKAAILRYFEHRWEEQGIVTCPYSLVPKKSRGRQDQSPGVSIKGNLPKWCPCKFEHALGSAMEKDIVE